jgi:glutathione S-transferase
VLIEGLRYSPWTEKARWALDHHEIPYAYREHLILLGMPRLRWEMRKPFGDITVPVLLLGGGKYVMDSMEIARWADERGTQPKLMPSELDGDIKRWNDICENATDAARGVLLVRMAENPEAQRSGLPDFIPGALRGPLSFMTRVGMNYIAREFNSRSKQFDEHIQRMRDFALEVRKSIKGNYLAGQFSYLDISVASTLNIIQPAGQKFLQVSESMRSLWTQDEMVKEFGDLLDWRDRIYSLHRKRRLKP